MYDVGFEQAIQDYAIHLLSLTYQKIPRAILAEVFLNSPPQIIFVLLLIYILGFFMSIAWCS